HVGRVPDRTAFAVWRPLRPHLPQEFSLCPACDTFLVDTCERSEFLSLDPYVSAKVIDADVERAAAFLLEGGDRHWQVVSFVIHAGVPSAEGDVVRSAKLIRGRYFCGCH